MSQKDYYFQFPLFALTYADTPAGRCDSIISYGLCAAGPSLWNNLPEEAQEEKLDLMQEKGGKPGNVDWEDDSHISAMYARYSMGITGGDMLHDFKIYAQVTEHVRRFEQRHGKDVLVRMKGNLVFEVRDGTGMSYREFAVLCAIYSVIGSKISPVRITLETIHARAHGYKSAKAFKSDTDANSYRADPCLPLLTRKQLRDTRDKLHQLGWFACATFGRRQTCYSNRLSDDDLRKKLVVSKTYSTGFKAERARKDDALTEVINAQRARNKVAAKRGQPRSPQAGN